MIWDGHRLHVQVVHSHFTITESYVLWLVCRFSVCGLHGFSAYD